LHGSKQLTLDDPIVLQQRITPVYPTFPPNAS